jgi:hypothetical protein
MAKPFMSLAKVITALATRAAQSPEPAADVEDLRAATGLSLVQVRRAVWAALEQGFVRHATPSRRKRPGAKPASRGSYVYELTPAGRNHRAAKLAATAPRP